MQLSKLEIKGFKSFGNHATVLFDKGVTGIVGPNGCGKSNVVDAIRWVLGEQKTKSLRSDKMENVIFNGTKKRKPLPTAEVSLTFDNTKKLLPSEYTQVTITRRYHRTGDSEYLINDVRCRLKDINNLFMDTGIGPDSYAIIELKKVDEILNDKDHSRRDLFEKAAGISKYKTRKKESFARLEAVDKDLARVGDLLYEIEKNLRSLERQAKQAERFFKLKDAYKETSLLYARKAISRQRLQFTEIAKKIEQETEKRSNLQLHISDQEETIDHQKEQLGHLEKALNHKRKLLHEHLTKIKSIENEQKLKAQRLAHLNEKNENIRALIQQDIQSQLGIREEIQKLEEEKEGSQAILHQIQDNLEQWKAEYEDQKLIAAELQQKLKVNEEVYQGKQGLLYKLNRDYEVKRTQLNSAKQEMEKTAGNNERLRGEFDRYEMEMSDIMEALNQAKQELEVLKTREEEKVQETEALAEEVAELKMDLNDLQRNLDAKSNEFKLTKSLVENMEGFPEALKFLKKDTDWADQFPLLSDIISCDEKYQLAIENYLDPWVNHYVVNQEKDAYLAIQLLKEHQKGKVNFLILDELAKVYDDASLEQNTLNPQASAFFGGLNPTQLKSSLGDGSPVPALEVINYESQHAALIYYLLRDLYIVEDVQSLELEESKSYVSLEGDVIRRQFSITGGSVGSFEGKRIGRIQNLEQLDEEMQEIQAQITQTQETFTFKSAQLKSLKENKTLQQAYQEALKNVNQINEQYISLRGKKEQLSQIIDNSVSRHEENAERIYELQEEIADLEPQLDQEQEEANQLNDLIIGLRERYDFENETLSVKSSRFNEKNIQYHQQKNRVNTYDQDLHYQQKNLEVLKQRIEKHEIELKQVEESLEQLLETQENFEETLQNLHEHTNNYEINVQGSEEAYHEHKISIQQYEQGLKEAQRQKEAQDALLNQLQNQLHETKLSLNSIQERLSVEFQIGIDELLEDQEEMEEEPEELSEEELAEKASGLKQKMDRLGTINPMAMEAYKEMKERHDFISTQKGDLETSKESLLKTINEMEEYARNAFMEAFEQIRENFIRVFRSLFSAEDKADLTLSDPENPLDAKIDIIAQPKGKRPLTIDQLSGGEKTLTSTSLLFALYLLKPAPFCIFDEVDAPLDDANTDKFNNIIREFAKESQFIIVTHNKRTMSNTDIMYGVTMIEDGVSSVVPVDLRNVEQETGMRVE